MNLVAQEGGEDALLATSLHFCAQGKRRAIAGRWVPMATISRLRPPSRHPDHPHGEERLTAYRRKRQEFPLKLPPKELWDDLMQAFEDLKATCKEPTGTKYHWRNWMSDSTWLLTRQHTSLKRAGQLRRCDGQRMQHTIYAEQKKDRAARTAQVGDSIVSVHTKGNLHETFCHLKGWYWSTTDMQAQPCYQTMEKQTLEHVELYRRRDSPDPPLTVNVGLLTKEIRDDRPPNGKIWVVVAKLTNGRSAGASRMRAEHINDWLQGAQLEENPETGPSNVGAGDKWNALVQLVQAIWDKGKIPIQLGWVVTLLIPKIGGDYRGISLLKPIWKVVKQVMDHRLEVIALHDSLHNCRNWQGTGTAVIKAKLAQQLAHIEQAPFYGVFIDLKKAFDAMDRERCLLILEGHGMGPNMRRLICQFWDKATNMCRASGNYGTPFKAGRGVT